MLQEYFDELKHVDGKPSWLFDPKTVVEQSNLFTFHPEVRELHAYVLDDENTSNHHFLITAEPLAGCIFFLSHDDDSRVVFDSISDFLNAVNAAQARGLSVSNFHPHLSPVAKDQAAMTSFMHALFQRGECNDLIVSLIPSLDLKDISLLQMLVSDSDFYLGEAVAIEIGKRPSNALLPIATACANHIHLQVSRAGTRALQRIQQLS